MRRLLPCIIVVMLSLGCSPQIPSIVSRSIDSVVYVQNVHGGGSGFAVAPNVVCTARHVVQGKPLPTLVLQNGQTVVATSTSWSSEYDVGLIMIGEPLLKPLRFRDNEDLVLGQVVIAIGSTWGKEHMNSVSVGNVQQLNFLGDPSRGLSSLFSHTAVGGPGNSGCPILDTSGRVVGMWVCSEPPMFHYAIPSWQIKEFLRHEDI
jgi:S1-C subfamily serine protease